MNKINNDTMTQAMELAEGLEERGCIVTVDGIRLLYETLCKNQFTKTEIALRTVQ